MVELFICLGVIHQSIKGGVIFEENSETSGGAIVALHLSLKTDNKLYFLNNVADDKGGAINIAILNHLSKSLLNQYRPISLSGNFFKQQSKIWRSSLL